MFARFHVVYLIIIHLNLDVITINLIIIWNFQPSRFNTIMYNISIKVNLVFLLLQINLKMSWLISFK